MYRDPRGGHNQKGFNKNFFKIWSPSMSYILGFIYADGAILDSRKSSRTCYLSISICDKDLLEEIKVSLKSKHPIQILPPQLQKFGDRTYLCKEKYKLRIGSKVIFQDLINLGVTPRKSLRMKLPVIPINYFNYFLRGYFDGDGCIYTKTPLGWKQPRVNVVFTSGSYIFIKQLINKLMPLLDIKRGTLTRRGTTCWLRYRKRDSLKILSFMYEGLKEAPYLERKYNKYINAATLS